MNKFKKNIITMFISIVSFVVAFGLIMSMDAIDKKTKNTTVLYTATISTVDITDTGSNIYCKINIKEYDTSLQISTNISKKIKTDEFKTLKQGQTIFFRIDTHKVEQMNRVAFVDIVSLRTDDKEFFSLDDYNLYIYEGAKPARIVGIAMALVSLIIFIMCIFKHKGQFHVLRKTHKDR